jgi:hypothetical protein
LTWAAPFWYKHKLKNSSSKLLLVNSLSNLSTSNFHDFVIDVNCMNLHSHHDYNGMNWDHVSEDPFPTHLVPLLDLLHTLGKKYIVTGSSNFNPSGGMHMPMVDIFDLTIAPKEV